MLDLRSALAFREPSRPSPWLVSFAAVALLAGTAFLVHDVRPPQDKPQAEGGLLLLTARSHAQEADTASVDVRISLRARWRGQADRGLVPLHTLEGAEPGTEIRVGWI